MSGEPGLNADCRIESDISTNSKYPLSPVPTPGVPRSLEIFAEIVTKVEIFAKIVTKVDKEQRLSLLVNFLAKKKKNH